MQSFEMFKGDTKHIIIKIEDQNGLVNLEGASITWKTKDITKSLGEGVQITGQGEVTVYLNPEDTVNSSGIVYHSLIVTDVHGNVSTVLKGVITIK